MLRSSARIRTTVVTLAVLGLLGGLAILPANAALFPGTAPPAVPRPPPRPPVPVVAWVILVHGFNPTTVPAPSVWYYGTDIYQQLLNRGYHVGVVSYYGTFTLTLSNGRTFFDPYFYGTTNTPIESVGIELGRALTVLFGAQPVTIDIVGHSMGGLVTLYMLEHMRLPNVHLQNVVFLGSPLGGAPITQLTQYDNMSGYQAQEMEAGSPFLTALQSHLPWAKANYPHTEWLVYAGDADTSWGMTYFGGPNDGLVAVQSDVALGYSHLYEFPDLHIPSLDVYDPGHVSYFEDWNVVHELEANFAGHY